MIDDIVELLARLRLSVTRLSVDAPKLASQSATDAQVKTFAEKYDEFQTLTIEAAHWPLRLTTRLGPSDPLTQKVNDPWNAFANLGPLNATPERIRAGEVKGRIAELWEPYNDAQAAVLAAAYDATKVRLP